MISVLVVEDVDTMRDLITHVLTGMEGVGVSGTARNGWEARLELSRRRPDLVLLDEILPGESSADLLRDIRAQGLPVLMLTGLKDAEHGIAEGAAGRLLKPGWDSIEADRSRMRAAIVAAITGPGSAPSQ